MFLTLCNNTSFDKGLQSIVINFSSLKNTQNYFFNFGQFRHYVQGFDLAWIVPLRTVKKFCRKLSIITVGK